MNEIWKDVVGYEWLYQVSNLWLVKWLPKVSWFLFKNGRILKPTKNSRYLKVKLSLNSIKKDFYIHRLVALNFLNNMFFLNFS